MKDQFKTGMDPTNKPGDVIRKSRAIKRDYQFKDSETAFRIAKQKAKNDPDYKNSDEYQSAITEYGKQRTQKIIRDLLAIRIK